MRIKNIAFIGFRGLIGFIGMIGLIGLCGLQSCNNSSDSNASSAGSSPDSSTIAAASNTGTNPAGANTTTDSSKRDTSTATSAMASNRSAKKHRRASINWPAAGTDAIVRDKDGVYNRAETMPEYPGGQTALAKYVNDNLEYGTYTEDPNNANVAKMNVSFVVDEKGKIMDVHEMGDNKVGGGVDDQVIKTITNMPEWKPGMVHGKKVKTRLQLPIDFQTE